MKSKSQSQVKKTPSIVRFFHSRRWNPINIEYVIFKNKCFIQCYLNLFVENGLLSLYEHSILNEQNQSVIFLFNSKLSKTDTNLGNRYVKENKIHMNR